MKTYTKAASLEKPHSKLLLKQDHFTKLTPVDSAFTTFEGFCI